MFNSDYKEKAIRNLKRANEEYSKTYDKILISIQSLHINRKNALSLIKTIEKFINSLANTPKSFSETIEIIHINSQKFDDTIKKIEKESQETEITSKGVITGGLVAGTGVATLGPTVAMGIATTFGTASTGTAISALHGAAATKAALAWLGGGAISAGGGGIAAGNAFLALAGPVGWVIGGTAILGGSYLLSSKNKEIAIKAENDTYNIKKANTNLKITDEKINHLDKVTTDLRNSIKPLYRDLMFSTDYNELTPLEQANLIKLLNFTETLSLEINKNVN